MITTAYAQTAGATMGSGSMLAGWLPVLLVFVVFYFLVLRPQQKRGRDHHEMIHTLNRGDQVVTVGGLFVKIHKIVDEKTLEVVLAEGVIVSIQRQAIASLVNKSGAAPEGVAAQKQIGKAAQPNKNHKPEAGKKAKKNK